MANPIGTAYIRIMPEAKGIESTISGTVADATEEGGKRGGNKYIAALKKVVTVAAIGKFVGDSLNAGAALEQSIGGIETLYKGASDKMMQYANQAYRTAGVDANTYMEQVTSYSAALISSMGKDVDGAADVANMAMIDMADNAAKMGTPLESIQMAYQGFARGQYQLLDNLKIGYGGTKEEMQRLLKDAEAITGVHYDISNLDDVYNAIHVIQDDLGITGTTAAEAAKTISGSIGMWKAAYKDLLANMALGEDIAPNIEALMESTIAVAKNVIPAVGNIVLAVPKVIIKHFPEIRNAVANGINAAMEWVRAAAPKAAAAVGNLLQSAGTAIIKNAPIILNKILDVTKKAVAFIGSHSGQIGTAVVNVLKQAGIMLVTNLPGVVNKIFSLAVTLVRSGINLAWSAAKALFSTIISGVGSFASNVVSKLRNGLSSVVNTITSPFRNAWNTLTGVVSKIKGLFPLKLGKIFSGIKLPHFKISGGKIPWGIGGAGKAPSVSVEWYAKGGIMTRPTLFGGGEAGAETIMPLDPFWTRLDGLIDGVNNSGDITINVYGDGLNPKEVAEEVERRLIQAQNRRRLAWQ